MVGRLTAFVILTCLAIPAMAEDLPNITQKCQELVTYQPSDDVEYKPGTDVDADGNPIAPADLDSGVKPIKLPETVEMAITIEQAQQLGLPVNVGYKPTAFIGQVSVNTKTGDTYFNGQRISQPQLQVLCQDAAKNQ